MRAPLLLLAALTVASCSGSEASDATSQSDLASVSSAPRAITPFGKMSAACVHAASDESAGGVDVDESSAVASCLTLRPAVTADTASEPPR